MSVFPPLRPFGRADVLAPTGRESAAFDRYAIEDLGVPQPVLMENAGRAAALVGARLLPSGPVVAVVGAGNNGGDALVLMRSLAAWGRDVTALLVADRDDDDALLHGWSFPVLRDRDPDFADDDVEHATARLLSRAAWVVDGILGTGVRGAPRQRQARAIRAIHEAGRPVLAIDIPSGVDGATGAVPGEAVRADVTVTFGAPKLGALLHPGRARVGRLVAVEIGFPPLGPEDAGGRVVTPAWALAHLPPRGSDTHKNAVGRLLIVAGREGMAGAAVLAARAALRAGAGLVRVCSDPSNREILQSAVPEAIFVDAADDAALEEALGLSEAVAAGPGMGTGPAAAALLTRVLEGPPLPTVLDADALTLAARDAVPGPGSVSAARPLLLTPHPGEMSRLRKAEPAEVAADRVGTVREAGEAYGCAVVLKGAPSLTTAPGWPVLVDTQGSSDLASAGMGDVLTGTCGSLLAQGLDPVHAGAVGLYLSGRAAVIAGRGRALVPGDVVRWLHRALAETGQGVTDLPFAFVTFDQDPAR